MRSLSGRSRRPGMGARGAWAGLLLCLLAAAPRPGQADDAEFSPVPESTSPWKIEDTYLYTSLYTAHFDPEPGHDNHQKMLGIELTMSSRWLLGLASFDNSFGQRSHYLYTGRRWSIPSHPSLFFKLTGGLLHGYKDEHQDKIPFNGLGVAPAIVPTLGYQKGGLILEVNLAGLAALTVTAGYNF